MKELPNEVVVEKFISYLDEFRVNVITRRYVMVSGDKVQVGTDYLQSYVLAEPEVARLKHEQPENISSAILAYWKVTDVTDEVTESE